MIDITGINLEQLIQDAFELSDHHEVFVRMGNTHEGRLPDEFVTQLADQNNSFMHVEVEGVPVKMDHRNKTCALELHLVQGRMVNLKVHRVIDQNSEHDRAKDRLYLDDEWSGHSHDALVELLRRQGRVTP